MKQAVYVASPDSQQIHVWQLDSAGELTLLQTVDVPGQVQPMAISPNQRHLYVGVRPDFGIVSYHIADDGTLTAAGMAPLPAARLTLTPIDKVASCSLLLTVSIASVLALLIRMA